MSKFKVGDVVVYSHALYASVRFKLGETFKVAHILRNGNLILESIDSKYKTIGSYTPDQFELVQDDAVLTPEEVFEHLRKGTKLQHLHGTHGWKDVTTPNELYYEDICNDNFRIKPEPEVIELNGKKYREIVE